jgi:formyltetrahydrofolate hydrolase
MEQNERLDIEQRVEIRGKSIVYSTYMQVLSHLRCEDFFIKLVDKGHSILNINL